MHTPLLRISLVKGSRNTHRTRTVRRPKPYTMSLKLREWLTIPETVRHLSNILDEEVSESDLLRIALDGHLKLSVYFVNHAYARCGKVVPYEDAEWEESTLASFLMSKKPLPDHVKGNPKKITRSNYP